MVEKGPMIPDIDSNFVLNRAIVKRFLVAIRMSNRETVFSCVGPSIDPSVREH